MAPQQLTPTIAELAQRIEADIRARGIKPGEPYMGTADTARMLGVSTTAANRALQLLAKRHVIIRRQRKGTFVAEPVQAAHGDQLQRVHLLVREDYLRREGLLNDGVVIGMQHELPGVDMQLNFMRAPDADEQVRALVDEALASSVREGFLATRSSLQTQRLLAGSGLPTVLLGSPHPSVATLPWIDRDHYDIGRLLVEHVIQRGAQRILLMQRDRILPGDFELYDGVMDTLAALGFGVDALTVRNLPDDAAAIGAAVESVMRKYEQPTAVIARSRPMADAALEAVEAMGRQLGEDVQITATDVYLGRGSVAPGYPYTQPAIDPETIGRHVGRLFEQASGGSAEGPNHEVIAVRLRLPEV
ncbi:substrate-binding domain-containing protein [Planctomycetales bacterium ZRK34]|nr:substrate-binding domain-containing protein [Planctomycetales bacterium ZRK34]